MCVHLQSPIYGDREPIVNSEFYLIFFLRFHLSHVITLSVTICVFAYVMASDDALHPV
jgi:hypothetical protein